MVRGVGSIVKIALVSPYDFAYPGGVVNHIVALEKHLTKMGHEVKIIAPTSRPIENYDSFIKIGKARPFPVKGTTLRISTSLRLSSRIDKVLEKEKFDIFHLHEPCMPMVCSTMLKFADAPIVGTFHASGVIPNYYFGWPVTTYKLKGAATGLSVRLPYPNRLWNMPKICARRLPDYPQWNRPGLFPSGCEADREIS